MKEYQHQLVICIVNAGYAPVVMDAAKKAGARGGTIIHGRGTANKEAEKLFQIVVHPDKELVMIVVEDSIKDAVMTAVNKDAGLDTAGQGIAFSLPVDRTIGIGAKDQEV
jgi:nitrogen regulatory protein PII